LDTVDYFKEALGNIQVRLQLPPDVKIYPVYLSFTNYEDQKDQKFFLNLPTSFFLPATDVDKLRQAGRDLLRQDSIYRMLLRDLGAAESPMTSAK
jgi:NTE family protein